MFLARCACIFSCSVRSESVTQWTVGCEASVHGITQAKILEWVAISSSRGFS